MSSSQDENETVATKWGTVVILKDDNYASWRDTAQLAIAAADAWDIVAGNEPRPANPVAAKEWDTRSSNAMRIINMSSGQLYSADLIPFAITKDAEGAWDELAKHDRSNDPVWVSEVRSRFSREIFDPANQTVRKFVNILRGYASKVSGTDRPIEDFEIRERLLSALPEGVGSELWQQSKQWCLRDQSDLNQTITLLQSCERSKPASANTVRGTDRGRNRGRRGGQGSRGSRRGRGGYRGRGRGGGRARGRGQYRGDRRSRERSRSSSLEVGPNQCKFCTKEGHWKGECLGYKQWKEEHFEEDRRAYRKALKRERSSVARSVRSTRSARSFREQSPSAYTGPNHAKCSIAISTESAMASIIPNRVSWILDSGATKHFTGIKTDLTNFKRWSIPKTVRIANGSLIESIGRGQASIGELELSEVWLVPDFGTTRLLSVKAFAQNGYDIIFTKEGVSCTRDKRLYFQAPLVNDVYAVEEAQIVSYDTKESINTKESAANLWHRRLAHTNHNDIFKLQSYSTGMGQFAPKSKPLGDHACEGCLAGKMKESLNKKTDSRTKERIRKVHCDTSGIRPTSFRGYKYYLLVTDDATRYSWVRFLKTKATDEVFPALMEVIHMIERETADKVVTVRADNDKGEFGPEFVRRCNEDGMAFEPCPAYKHSMNGVSERHIYTTDCKARSLLFDADLPPEFWCLAIDHAIWVKNRVPTSALPFGEGRLGTTKTPYDAYCDKVPNLQHLKAFGCAAYPILQKGKHPKHFDPRHRPGFMFVGMHGSSIWTVMSLATQKLERVGDCDFDEYQFPWQ